MHGKNSSYGVMRTNDNLKLIKYFLVLVLFSKLLQPLSRKYRMLVLEEFPVQISLTFPLKNMNKNCRQPKMNCKPELIATYVSK